MIPDINFWAVLLATVSSMVVGSIWYTPKVFGTYWMRVAKVTPGADGKSAVGPILVTVAVSFVTALVLAAAITVAHEYEAGSYLLTAVVTAVVLWAGLTAARFITHDAFEGRPVGLTALNCAHELVTLVVMALIIGAFGA